MTAHELAARLLSLPDVEVYTGWDRGDFFTSIRRIATETVYPDDGLASWKHPGVVLFFDRDSTQVSLTEPEEY